MTSGPDHTPSWLTKRAMESGGVLVFLLLCVVAWRFTALNQWVEPEAVMQGIRRFSDQKIVAPLVMLALYLVGNLIMFPVTVLVVATIGVFGPLVGYVYAVAGLTLSASATYVAGYWLGADALQRRRHWAWIDDINRHLEHRGIFSIFVLRLLPVAPFTLINLLIGAWRVRFRDYAIGSVLAFLTTVFGIAFVYAQIERAALARSPRAVVIAISLIVLLMACSVVLRWILVRIEVVVFRKKTR